MAGVVWLLDVDGVVNTKRPGWGGPPRRALACADGEGFVMRWAPQLVDRIRTLHASGAVEVRWATTWCPWAGELERLWGLPPLGRAFIEPLCGREARAAKLAAAHLVLVGGRRLVWTDDEAIPAGDAVLNWHRRAGLALLVEPRPNRGLQPQDMDAIEAFAAIREVGRV